MRYTRKRIGGSNPPLSAKKKRVPARSTLFFLRSQSLLTPILGALISASPRTIRAIHSASESLTFRKKEKSTRQGVLFFFLKSQSLLTPILGALISALPRTIRAIRSASKSLTFRKIYSVKILFNKCNAPLIVLTCCITT